MLLCEIIEILIFNFRPFFCALRFLLHCHLNSIYRIAYSMCCHHFLQIRNGKYGFSSAKKPPFGRYCGRKFPDEVISDDRYLWLRFHSDDNVEYEGFEGVFEYLPMDEKTGEIVINVKSLLPFPHWLLLLRQQILVNTS